MSVVHYGVIEKADNGFQVTPIRREQLCDGRGFPIACGNLDPPTFAGIATAAQAFAIECSMDPEFPWDLDGPPLESLELALEWWLLDRFPTALQGGTE